MQLLDSQTAVKQATVLVVPPTATVNQTVRSSKTAAMIFELFAVSIYIHCQ